MDNSVRDGTGDGRVVWDVVDGPIGPLLLLATPRGLAGVVFHARPEVCERFLGRATARLGVPPERDPRAPLLAEAIRQLTAYLSGGLREFSLPLDWSLLPGEAGFNGRVLRELAASVP
ncbi:methylated-DNA--[protein]-cysteine S-methyltransferase, partial [Streptomyces sp. UH6]|nr:methylated-DNA--[protein]-cysteine S-methyltransferase [Streptomyces sp. UH6]